MKPTDTPKHVERAAEQPEPPERREQADAGDGGGQHERQLDQRQHDRSSTEPAAGDEVGRRSADEKDDRLRDQARLGRDDEGVDDDISSQLVEEGARRDAQEHRRDGK